jgi:ArsR family transcriptional regulator, lead/cadmium/zinc/bismuth-responsive transcriptional repressor
MSSAAKQPQQGSGLDPVERFLAAPELSPDVALRVAQTFQALADPTRARIVYALTKGEHSVGDLARIAGISPSATSHQLKSLRELHIVRYRRLGTRIFYSVDDAHVAAMFREAIHHLAHVVFALPDHPDNPPVALVPPPPADEHAA